jgi:drug/metabolite transporter (DMT)-like permease
MRAMTLAKSPYLLLILATLIWGGNFVIGRAMVSDLPPYTFSLMRWMLAMAIFIPFTWKSIRAHQAVLKKNWKSIFLMSITGVAGFNTIMYVALQYTTSVNAALVNSSAPIIIAILSFFILKERIRGTQVIGISLSFVGLLVIISHGSLERVVNLSINIGDLLMLAAVAAWGLYSVIVKKKANELPPIPTFALSIVIGTFLLIPFSMIEILSVRGVLWSGEVVATILYVGILASLVAFLSWNTAVTVLGPSDASVFLNLIPVFASIFAVLFIDEQIFVSQVIGGCFVIGGVYITTVTRPMFKFSDTKKACSKGLKSDI